jgi:enoyl-CoA hydratase/carnithine racemase
MPIRVERSAGLATVTLNRPAKKNALDSQTWMELDRARLRSATVTEGSLS